MQQMVSAEDQRDLVHIQSAGLTSCARKGSTNGVYHQICTSTTIPAMRAKWWSKLSCDQKQLLASKLGFSLSDWDHRFLQKIQAKRKGYPCQGSAKNLEAQHSISQKDLRSAQSLA